MGSILEAPPHPWVETPCFKSTALSRKAGCNIFLKLENLQPSGSFKSRGIGNFLIKATERHGPSKPVHFYCSSGGNAGLACVTAATALGRPATIVVPSTASEFMRSKLTALGAEVVQRGNQWSEADAYLREHLLAKDPHGVYVPPFDHEDVWEGHASMISELERQMVPFSSYDALVCSIGGGGLFSGLMQGLENHGRLQGGSREGNGIKVLALETEGTASLATSLKEGKLICLPGILGIAMSLGAAQVAPKAFQWGQRPEVTSCVLTDAEAAMGSICFADDERILVEPACGISVATAYNGTIKNELFPNDTPEEFKRRNVVIVVCGGSNISLSLLDGYREKFGQDEAMLSKWWR
ncbi:serine family amino acid catabolism-related protein [Phlyctema vagabunda]|uniref:L-serine ammonia-lyase n=1 Tax=Phlyctema vagabunda TaxID=108571 RepID=A0ABR4PY54_9HELO